MTVAGGVVLLVHWLRQPVILGYLLAGIIIGPYSPPFSLVQDIPTIELLAEIGIVLLMFSLGLEFSLSKLRSVGKVAVIGGALQIFIVFILGYIAGQLLGWNDSNSLILGSALSISSTALIIKVLEDQKRLNDKSSHIVFGILVFEDFAAVAMIAVFGGSGAGEGLDFSAVWSVLWKITLFLAATLTLGLIIVPRMMRYVLSMKRREVEVIVGLGVCFGLAIISKSLGLSVAAGAFVAGALVAEAKNGDFAHTMAPIRDMFAAIFFVAIGMLFDISFLVDYWWVIILLTAVLIAGKVFAGTVATFLMGYDRRTALQTGMCLAQVGEFSLIIVRVGQDSGAASSFLYPIIVGVTILSTLCTPYLISNSARAGSFLDKVLPARLQQLLDKAEIAIQRFQSRPPVRKVDTETA